MKVRIYLLALLILAATFGAPNRSFARGTLTKEQQELRVIEIKERVDAIKAMDFSTLNKAQRLDLKQELKGMHKELKSTHGPIVIVFSLGALILVILLLLLLL